MSNTDTTSVPDSVSTAVLVVSKFDPEGRKEVRG